MTDAGDSGLGQQLLYNPFRLIVFPLAEVLMSDMPLRIDEIEGWPVLVVESTPYRVVVIDGDREIDSHVAHGSAHVFQVFLERELRRVRADHHQSPAPCTSRPRRGHREACGAN